MSNIYDWKNGIDNDELKIVIEKLRSGEIIVFPTETVYGIGANVYDEKAVSKIYEAKGRPTDNPLIVHVSDIDMLNKMVMNINDIEKKLIDNFMPGPFTLILERKENIPDVVTAGLDTVAIRMPKNEIANRIIRELGVPIAAPSANISGRPSGTRIEDIKSELCDKVSIIIDGGESEVGLESTVVKVINNVPVILRPGKVSKEDILRIVGKVEIDKNILEKVDLKEKVESPGMKHRHYSPSTNCILISIHDEEKRIKKINEMIKEDVCIIGFEEHRKLINTDKFISLGSMNNLNEVSKNIFSSLRKADKMNCKLILIEGVENKEIGLAIMNRLVRACNWNVIE